MLKKVKGAYITSYKRGHERPFFRRIDITRNMWKEKTSMDLDDHGQVHGDMGQTGVELEGVELAGE